jgi:hypothetical protein
VRAGLIYSKYNPDYCWGIISGLIVSEVYLSIEKPTTLITKNRPLGHFEVKNSQRKADHFHIEKPSRGKAYWHGRIAALERRIGQR